MKKKKRIKIIIIAVLVVAVAAGSITGVVYYRNSKGLASVMSVSMISTTNDYTSMTSEGMVCDDACQTINLKDGQKVTEVYVTKDQQVKAGDKLLAYDVTSLSLSVEMKQLEIQSLENQLASEKQKLDKLKNTKPVEKQPESPVTPEPQPDTQPDAPEQKPDEEHDVISDLSEAKGIACDEAKRILDDTHLSGAVISVGGSLLLWGSRPGGGDWKVGVRDPRGETSDQLGVFTLAEGFVSTSGDYERTLTADGKTYHHILDPKTGYPADAGLISVTVTAPSGLLSDALSTACFILGYEKSLPLLDAFGAEAIFVTKEKQVITTPGLKQTFQLTNNAYHLIQDT